MPSKILLLSANRCTTPEPVFPLGLAHLNAALREAGHQVAWADALASPGDFVAQLNGFRPDAVGISLRNIDDVLIRKQETFFGDLARLGAIARTEWKCPIILGGSGFSIFPEQLLDLAQADFGIAGEGEAAFLALIAALETKGYYQDIPGLVYRQGNQIVANTPAHATLDRDLLEADRPGPIAAFYVQHGGMLNLQTQRGCAHRCCYCTYPVIEGRQHRRRPPERVAAEFERLVRAGARYAFVVDSIFNSSPRHITEICEALIRRNNTLPWGCFLRPQGLTPELMKLMARAGLKHVEFGTDSFCNSVLKTYQKGFTFDDIARSSEFASRENIDFCHFLIAGGPGETLETLEEGFQNSLQLQGAIIMAVVGMRIYPGTDLFQRAAAEGRIQPDANLLTPTYYLAPGLEQEMVFARLQEFSRRSPNWIAGDPDPAYQKLVSRLRQRGVVGPLWSYFAMIQRLWPQGLSPQPVPRP